MFETDEDDFMFSPSSKLSSIFSTTPNSDSNNASLTYKAPKQPKPLDTTKTPKAESNSENQNQAQSSVVLAKVVTLWKLENGKNKAVGKHMAAIIANSSNDCFEVIVYQEKTKIVIRETLGTSLKFYKYPNNFVAFYDSAKQLWNLNFDNSDIRDIFLQHASKYNCVIIDQTEQNTDERDGSKNNNVSEISSNADKEISSKEKILSRITKMGQPILPRSVDRTRNSDISDSETESSVSDSRPTKPVTAPRKFKRNVNNHEKALTPMLSDSHSNFTPHLPSNNNFLLPSNQMVLSPHTTGVVYSQPMPDYSLSNFIIAQNAELKANLAEINVKLNNVLSSSDNNGNTRDNSHLNTTIKCQNLKIDNLSTDLGRLQKALEEMRRQYDTKCEEFLKLQNKLEQVEAVEDEISILRNKVQNIDVLQNEIDQVKGELKEKNILIECQSLNLKDFEENFKMNELLNERLSRENIDIKQKFEETSLKLEEYEEKIKRKENDLGVIQEQNLKLEKDSINKIIKESMNEAFVSIMGNFEENKTYGFQHIQGVLLDNLKKTSYRLMNSL